MISGSRYTKLLITLGICLTWGVILSACSFASQPATATVSTPITVTPELLPTSLPTNTPFAQPSSAQSLDTVVAPPAIIESTSTAPPDVVVTQQGVIDFPNAEDFSWQPIVTGLEQPIGLVNANDGSERLFVIERSGLIRIIQDKTLLPMPYLDIQDQVGDGSSEQGLLGLAFHPRYKENGYFFVNYTDLNGNTLIARFQVAGQDPNQADASSEERLLGVAQPYRNHNGGGIVFGPDGYLYLGLGDGGAANDPEGNAQSLTSYLGKILRIDVDRGPGYSIPAENPYDGSAGLPEIWAYGLRNPWRFSFDRLTGDLFIGDVGQNMWEEINYLPSGSRGGANLGWDYREGKHPFEGQTPEGLSMIDPVAEYDHSQGCSVTGGYIYRGQALSSWQGVYFFGDYCTGLVWGLINTPDRSWVQKALFETGANITSFGEDENGEIYLVDYNGGIYQLISAER